MDVCTNEELAAIVAAAHARALAQEVEQYLSAVIAFDAEGHAPFRTVRERAGLERELVDVAVVAR